MISVQPEVHTRAGTSIALILVRPPLGQQRRADQVALSHPSSRPRPGAERWTEQGFQYWTFPPDYDRRVVEIMRQLRLERFGSAPGTAIGGATRPARRRRHFEPFLRSRKALALSVAAVIRVGPILGVKRYRSRAPLPRTLTCRFHGKFGSTHRLSFNAHRESNESRPFRISRAASVRWRWSRRRPHEHQKRSRTAPASRSATGPPRTTGRT